MWRRAAGKCLRPCLCSSPCSATCDPQLRLSRVWGRVVCCCVVLQALAQYDCLFRNRETADWVAYGDFDEYMVDSFPRPRTLRGFLCEQTGWGVAFLSYGNFEFTRDCNQTDLWNPSLGRMAVEYPLTRTKYATCYPGERSHPNDCQGRRKFFANPRRVSSFRPRPPGG